MKPASHTNEKSRCSLLYGKKNKNQIKEVLNFKTTGRNSPEENWHRGSRTPALNAFTRPSLCLQLSFSIDPHKSQSEVISRSHIVGPDGPTHTKNRYNMHTSAFACSRASPKYTHKIALLTHSKINGLARLWVLQPV